MENFDKVFNEVLTEFLRYQGPTGDENFSMPFIRYKLEMPQSERDSIAGVLKKDLQGKPDYIVKSIDLKDQVLF